MNKKKIDIVYKWYLRFRYFRILCIGAALISFSIGLFISDYSIINKPGFDIFISILTLLLGIIFSFIGLYYRVETENGIQEKNKN
ncbi:hypothetical protein KO494_04890 [Lacinutrix sp. C3R15]|uniref:hypothetical protein n=1 Tax=Flavobacteriaceae TaxID=49546 RepID=UPI001C0A4DC0|nr:MULTISPECIES: hypothetical protein [Flavobacteriaceae]MBU2938874.1 hypothetical protein [Lacinutrix sp. C3R15]MDO6622187.1 hypothetical protein [Oceanihabitans sp. 1_MG-2023]